MQKVMRKVITLMILTATHCIYLCTGNGANWCEAHKECRSESSCKHVNKCKDFVFADCEPEYQDAFGETNGYHPREPREPKKKQCDGQMNLFESEGEE